MAKSPATGVVRKNHLKPRSVRLAATDSPFRKGIPYFSEIALVVSQCGQQREQELDESLLELPEVFAEDVDAAEGEFDPDEDPLLEKAIEIVVQTQTASVSLIQRRLRVGYTRAGRLIDMLERRGIISGYEGSKPRRVLVEDTEHIAL